MYHAQTRSNGGSMMNKDTMTIRKIRRLWRPLVGIAGLIVIIIWAGGSCNSKVSPGKVSYEPGFDLPSGAQKYTVTGISVTPRIDVVGTVASEEKIHLSARFPGYVKEVFVSAGTRVTKGQALITLDDREIAELKRAAASQYKLSEIEYKRTRSLFEKKATTDQALVAAESMYTSARAEYQRVEVMLSYTKITSPISGIVIDRRVEAGDLANPGQVLLTVYDPKSMRLEAPVPVRLIDNLSLEQIVEVTLDRPEKTFTGVVTEIVSEVDPTTRTQEVKVHLEGAGEEVLPGTFGRLWVNTDTRDGIYVPGTAVYRIGQLDMVQVVEADRGYRRLVRTGPAYGNAVEVISGISEGEIIVLNPAKGQ